MATEDLANACLRVLCVHTSTEPSPSKNSSNFFTLPDSDSGEHKSCSGWSIQSLWKPLSESIWLRNEEPIDFSGTLTITLPICLCLSFSRATYIRALDLPDAGGDLSSMCCCALFSNTRACMGLIPKAFSCTDAPEAEYSALICIGLQPFNIKPHESANSQLHILWVGNSKN